MKPSPSDPLLAPRPRAARERSATLVDLSCDPAQLDPAQRAAVSLPAGRALLVLGEAGHGKTTVAVHRLAHLWRASPEPLRAAVVAPHEGLARLLQSLLRRLGVDVEALTYDRWAASQARRAFPFVPRRECELTSPAVARVKRDPALRLALAELATREPGRIDDDRDARPGRARAHVRRGDLQHLFGDRVLLERVAEASSELRPHARHLVDATLEHTRIQFSLSAEREWRHVTDRERLVAVDRRALDEGTSTEDAGTIDVEDYAVLFELDRMRAARRGRPATAPRPWDAILVDEAQELAPLELALLGRSVAPGGTLIVAGDSDQHTGATGAFVGWEAAMRELGAEGHATARLDVGYRCPPANAALARAILGLPPPPPERTAAAAGAPPALVAFEDDAALVARLGRELRALARRDPRASVLVVCRSPLFARGLAIRLRREVPVRLVFDGAFLPRGPAQVTTVEETKGLEFDVVIVADATAKDYPDTAASRRALYVAVTRARHQVLLAHVGAPTPLVAGARELLRLTPPGSSRPPAAASGRRGTP